MAHSQNPKNTSTLPAVTAPSTLAGSDALRKANDYAVKSRAEATIRAYRNDFGQFCDWCEARGVQSLPADAATVAAWVADLADTLKPSSINRKVAGISVAHKTAGYPSPCGSELVRSTLSGIRRTLGVAQSKKAPVRISHLRAACSDFPEDSRGKRDRALILIGYAGGFRRSELAALEACDVETVPEGIIITVRRSKTDQDGAGTRKAIHHGRDSKTCPVKALKAWMAEAGITEGAIFRSVDRWGNVGRSGITSQVVSDVVKDRARLLGLDPDALGAHSLRSGLVTDGYAAGVAEADIMRQTGHRSRQVLEGYYREANLFRGNVTARVGL
jgi:site-specific recombinase XerD